MPESDDHHFESGSPSTGGPWSDEDALASCEADELVEWITHLGETDSPHLPAARWLLAHGPTSAPADGELEALLADFDERRPSLLPAVLRIMRSMPSARAVAQRWRPRERSEREAIVRKYMTFHSRASRLIERSDAQALRISEEMAEMLDGLTRPDPGADLGGRLIDQPLEKLRAMERLIDDNGLSIPRRIVAIHQLLMGQ